MSVPAAQPVVGDMSHALADLVGRWHQLDPVIREKALRQDIKSRQARIRRAARRRNRRAALRARKALR
jgi:hypothetical protein